MSALSNLYAAAEDIRTLLMPFAFLLCVLGLGEMGWRAGSDARAVLGALLRTIIVVALIAGYPSAMKTGQQAFIEMRSNFTTARDAKFVQLLSSRIQNQPSDSWTNLGKIVPAAIGYFFQGIGRFMLILLRFFQEFAIAGLIAVSPLLIGFLFFSYTQSFGFQFGVTSLTVLLWYVAICLVAFQSGNTTVLFPSAISGLYAKSVAVQEQPNAVFVLSFTPGNFYFTVRALKKDAGDHLTVIYNRKAYVLRLTASDKPFYSVTFFQGGNTRAAARPVVPERLLSLLDKAKAYPLFQKDHPDALAGILHAAPNATNYYENFRVVTRDVWRFEEEDTLIFRIDLENTSDGTIYYKPHDLAVRLEDRIYTQSLADASGVMPPRSTTPTFFAITGNGTGGRNNLAPDNKWNVLVVRVQQEDDK
jgi:hypothetical protein